MKIFNGKKMLALAAVSLAAAAGADVMDRPVGVKIGQRMTLKPYLAFSGAYDSNVDGRRDGSEDVVWVVNPGLGLEYKAESFILIANAWYQYNAYTKGESTSENSYHSYGEDITFRWTDSLPGEKGWSLMMTEKYSKINQTENIMDTAGHEYGRDRQEVKLAGALQRRFGRGWHADVNANYYWLDYDNNNNQGNTYGLYGWERWGVGLEGGYALTQWTDFLIAGSYSGYDQDNRRNNYYSGRNSSYGTSSHSDGWTVQGGFGSFATERITYRALGGWSCFKYKEGGKTSNGFTYTVSGNWTITETWKTMLLATSYYQPTEREYGSSQRVDALSWGIAHSMVRGKLHGTFDVAYRREGREHDEVESYDYDLDIVTFRIGLTYILNRYIQFFGNVEYRKSMCEDDDSVQGDYYAYDRFRGTLGLRFTY